MLDFLQMSFTLRFNIWLKWIDNRLHYQNLNYDYYQNVIPEDQASKLWKPILLFKNSNEGQILEFDPATSDIMMKRNSASFESPLSQKAEARVYQSNETELRWSSVQFKKFKCKFDLYYLPFDHQTCYVQVQPRPKNFTVKL